MYKNFKLTDEERKQIMEQHKMHGYKKPLKEDVSMDDAPEDDMSTGGEQNYCNTEYGSKLGFDFMNDGCGNCSAWWDKDVNGFGLHGVDDYDGVYYLLTVTGPYGERGYTPAPKNIISSIESIATSMGGKFYMEKAHAIFKFPQKNKNKTIHNKNCKTYYDFCAKVVQFLKKQKPLKLNEQQSGSLKGKTFDQYEQGALEARNFKINISNTHAVLNNPLPANIITVMKDVKSGGYTIIKGGTIDGYDTYKGGGKVLFTGPHDDCDVQLDKIIGYDSLGGGYGKKKMQEQGEPTSLPNPSGPIPPKPRKNPAATSTTKTTEKSEVPATKVDPNNSLYNGSTKHTQINPTDPAFGKNIKQSDKLIGKKATFYAIESDAIAAYQAGKSNPQSQGSLIALVDSIDYSDNDTLHIRITPDSAKTNYSTTTQTVILGFDRFNGTFSNIADRKVYYSESVKNILMNDYFSTELASNNKAQQSNMSEEIDTDDEEMELSKLYNDEDEYSYDLDSDVETGQFSSEFSDPDEWEDLHDFSVARHRLPKEKADNMGYSRPRDMDYKGAQHHNEIPGAQRDDIQSYPTWDSRFVPKVKNSDSDYYLRTYGTPDPDMESQTLADLKKNQPLNFPKYTDKDRRDRENLMSWEEKKKLMAQREEKRIARELARQARQGKMNESTVESMIDSGEIIDKDMIELPSNSLFPTGVYGSIHFYRRKASTEGQSVAFLKITDSEIINAVKNAKNKKGMQIKGGHWHIKKDDSNTIEFTIPKTPKGFINTIKAGFSESSTVIATMPKPNFINSRGQLGVQWYWDNGENNLFIEFAIMNDHYQEYVKLMDEVTKNLKDKKPMNESIQLTESELVNLIKKIINEAK